MIIFTKHAKDKLKRKDIKSFKVNSKLIKEIVSNLQTQTLTEYEDYSKVSKLDKKHDIRIIYDIIDGDIKVITFHIAKKGRYR